MNFDVKGSSLRILKHLAKPKREKGPQFPIGFLGSYSEFEKAQAWLYDNGYIDRDGKKLSLTDKAVKYLEEYDDYGLKLIYHGGFNFVLIETLYNLSEPIPIDCLPKGLLGEVPSTVMMRSSSPITEMQTYLFESAWLRKYVVISNNQVSLNVAGRKYVEHMKEEAEKPDEETEAEAMPFAQYFDHSVHTHSHGNNSNINVGNIITGNNNTLSHTSFIINEGDENNLINYGVSTEEIAELKKIFKEEAKDKSSLWAKVFKWVQGVAVNVASKGLSEHIPAIIQMVHNMLPPIT